MKPYLLIIDGNSLLTTHFYGNMPFGMKKAKTIEEKESFLPQLLQTKNGTYTNALLGFFRDFLRILNNQKPDYLAICWDKNRETTFRRELYPEYKAQRPAGMEALHQQYNIAYQILQAMRVRQFVSDTYEADDLAGSLAKQMENEIDVRILTKDRDYFQLVSKKINLWIPKGSKEIADTFMKEHGRDLSDYNLPNRIVPMDIPLIHEAYGFGPGAVIGIKALAGDVSDNIKGVPGVGEKTAIALMSFYGSVSQLYEDLHKRTEDEITTFWKRIGVKRSPYKHLMATSDTELVGKEAALLSEKLATICTNIVFKKSDGKKIQLSDLSTKRFDLVTADLLLEKLEIQEYRFCA